ncbi:efflux RND transporter periplasmic adaptor subunit [Solimicrobium silvestre]|uniref:Efflux transporter, RND family, MFP subunit n=1 Tax=Solimicrobium silvestre TaxID=2099400 RepID=A0A2S9H011_9BURK|nr:efflux RND transporter periplasmic adaptor subunit [Solimicrobium silvestre]PRC93307.1 Efflux transporter, RND family, MFP subunit [Solimicrobium silvestre]
MPFTSTTTSNKLHFASQKIVQFVQISCVASMICLLAACSKPVEKVEEVRPVRAVMVGAGSADVLAEFSGELRPRVESRLGFRVAGKIVARKVDVGTVVKRGQLLMQLDGQDLALAQVQSSAGLRAAESSRDLARAELKRYTELRAENFVSQAVLDSKTTAYQGAQASYEQAAAAQKNQSNQSSYGSLLADVDGVVTEIDAEVGQVVAAGTPVVRVAQSGEIDAVIGIPEDKVNAIRNISDVRVRIWANPNSSIAGKLRELSPIADPVTRTYTVKIALPNDVKDIKLGMTAYVTFAAKTATSVLKLPTTALFQDKNVTSVWLVEQGHVRLVPIQVAGSAGEDVLVASGISAGQTVVTAGVNMLKEGQKVQILGAVQAANVTAPVTGSDSTSTPTSAVSVPALHPVAAVTDVFSASAGVTQ